MNKIVCISGATSGIGYYSAVEFAKLGYNLIITGRRKDRLVEIEKELREKYKVDIISLNFDVRVRDEVEENLNSLPSDWRDRKSGV